MKKTGLIMSAAIAASLLLGIIVFLPDSPAPTPMPSSNITVSAGVDQSNAALVDQYCVACHNATLKTGGLELDAYDVNNIEAHPDVWERVLRKLRANAMPPTGMPRPDEIRFAKFEEDVASTLNTLALKRRRKKDEEMEKRR